MRIQIETLGCKMNFVDSERLAKELTKKGFEISDQNPEIAIINTCTVTDTADRKSLSKARKLQKTAKKLIITGCSARAEKEAIKKLFPKAEVFENNLQILDYFEEIEADKQATSPFVSSRTRAFIEIQNGCDTYCSYCIVPFTRGRHHSRSADEIIAEIKQKEIEGFREIVLTGINLAAWGAESTNKPEGSKFASLLEQILKQTGIERVRISSVGAKFLNDDFFDVFHDERICAHLHISIQSGSDKILALMNRGHGSDDIRKVAEKAKKIRPLGALTSDFIVGFPAEMEQDFLASMQLAQDLKLSKLHVFPFSLRKGTIAEKLEPKISEEIKKERAGELKKLGTKLRAKFIEKNLNQEAKVLFETEETGWTENYIKVKKAGAKENEIIKIKLNKDNIIF